MPKGLIFFCCACCVLLLTIVNLSIAPITSGTIGSGWGYQNCAYLKDAYDDAKDAPGHIDDQIKYNQKWNWQECTRKKGMHDMEYTAFIFDIVIGFVCGLLGLLHLFGIPKNFEEKTGLIGLCCGGVGFILTFVYVVFNGLVYTTYSLDYILPTSTIDYKRNGDGAFAELKGDKYECLYYDKQYNDHSYIATYSDLLKKQYNYDKDYLKDIDTNCRSSASICVRKESLPGPIKDTKNNDCKYLYDKEIYYTITNKDVSGRFLTALILSLVVCLGNIGLGIFGFLIAKSGEF